MDEMLALAQRFGTPLYVFDGRTLQKRIETLRAALPANVELCYAVKANTFIVDLLAGDIDPTREIEDFHSFIENVSPEDFLYGIDSSKPFEGREPQNQ